MGKANIDISGLSVSYLTRNTEAERIIFFIHGNSISSKSWNKQLDSRLLEDYQLIAFDLPAHGDSQASINPEQDYSLTGLANIMAQAVKQVAGLKPYLLAGISLGSNIIAEMLNFNIQPAGIALAGCCITGKGYEIESFILPDTNVHVVFTERAAAAEVIQYALEGMITTDKADLDQFVTDYYRVQPTFRSNLSTSIQKQQYSDEIALLSIFPSPILLIFGKYERIINPNYLDHSPLHKWNQTIYKIPGASHLVNIDQPEAFNRLLAAYAAAQFK